MSVFLDWHFLCFFEISDQVIPDLIGNKVVPDLIGNLTNTKLIIKTIRYDQTISR